MVVSVVCRSNECSVDMAGSGSIRIDIAAGRFIMNRMKAPCWILLLAALALLAPRRAAADGSYLQDWGNILVDNETLHIRDGGVNLGTFPGNITFWFKTGGDFDRNPGAARRSLDHHRRWPVVRRWQYHHGAP